MSDLYWPQDFRHLDVKGSPTFTGNVGFSERVVAGKDGVWYEIISLPEDHPERDKVMTPRKVKPLENARLLKALGPADEWLAKDKRMRVSA